MFSLSETTLFWMKSDVEMMTLGWKKIFISHHAQNICRIVLSKCKTQEKIDLNWECKIEEEKTREIQSKDKKIYTQNSKG